MTRRRSRAIPLAVGLAVLVSCSDSRPDSLPGAAAGPIEIDTPAGSVISVNKVDDADQSDRWNVTVDFDVSVLGVGLRANVWVDEENVACLEGAELPGGSGNLVTGQRVVVQWRRGPVGLSNPPTIWADAISADCGE